MVHGITDEVHGCKLSNLTVLRPGLTCMIQWSYEKTKTWNEEMRTVMKDRRLHVYHDV